MSERGIELYNKGEYTAELEQLNDADGIFLLTVTERYPDLASLCLTRDELTLLRDRISWFLRATSRKKRGSIGR